MSPDDVVVCASFLGRFVPTDPTCSKPPYMDICMVSGSSSHNFRSSSTDSLSSHATSTIVSAIFNCSIFSCASSVVFSFSTSVSCCSSVTAEELISSDDTSVPEAVPALALPQPSRETAIAVIIAYKTIPLFFIGFQPLVFELTFHFLIIISSAFRNIQYLY